MPKKSERTKNMDVLQLLLSREKELPVREKDVKIKRLSPKGEEQVIFSLKSLSYDRVCDIKKTGGDEVKLHILLAGITAPDLKNQDLIDHYGAESPMGLLKKMLLPGEIEDLCIEIERLSGYQSLTLESVAKKSQPTRS